jgi:carboxymethylenebutenolidase
MGQMIEFPANGGTCPGYLALPAAGNANGRGVVVLQEWWGLVPHIKDVADRFAAEGYAALAPDLWRGERTTNPDEAGRLFMALNIDQAELDLRGAINALKSEADLIGKVGVVGFCMGGKLALLAATTSDNDVGAAVDFYGIHPNIKPDFSRLSCPVMGFFGDQDAFVPPSAVEELARDVDAAGGEFDYTIYPGAGHAFFNDTRPEAYDPSVAADAWERTLSFLSDNLEGEERADQGSGAQADDADETEAEEVDVSIDDDDEEREEDEAAEDRREEGRDQEGDGDGDGDDEALVKDDDEDEDDDDDDEDEPEAETEEEPVAAEADPGEVAVDEDDVEEVEEIEEVAGDHIEADSEPGDTNGAVRRPATERGAARARPPARNAAKAPRKASPAAKPKPPARKAAAKAEPARKANAARKPTAKAAPARKPAAAAKAGARKAASKPPARKAASKPAARKPVKAASKPAARKASKPAARKPAPPARKAAASKTRSTRKGK